MMKIGGYMVGGIGYLYTMDIQTMHTIMLPITKLI